MQWPTLTPVYVTGTARPILLGSCCIVMVFGAIYNAVKIWPFGVITLSFRANLWCSGQP